MDETMTMTWMQLAVGVAGVAVAAWLGSWTLADRRFAELRGAIDRADEKNDKALAELRGAIDRSNENNDKAHAELRGAIDRVNGRLDTLAADVHVLVGRQQERDRAPSE